MTILIPLLLVFLLLLSLGVVAVAARPRYRGYAPSQSNVTPSPESKVTPLGMYRLRRVRFDVPLEDGVKRARERVYVPLPGEETVEEGESA